MKNKHITAAGIIGTTSFTLFSYLMARAFREKFQQPRLLGRLIDTTVPGLNKREAGIAGWTLHYVIGFAFAQAYAMLINTNKVQPTFKDGCIAGAVSGLPAVLVWHSVLKNHPAPPRTPSHDYNLELFLGHVIFGAGTFLTLRYYKNRERRRPVDRLTS